MKRFIVSISVLISIFILFEPLALPVHAYSDCPSGFENLCKIDIGNNPNIFGNIISILLTIAIVVSLLYLIWGGIKWITSEGDKAKVDQARKAVIAAIIGLVISLLGFFIINLAVALFTGSDLLKTLPIPKLV